MARKHPLFPTFNEVKTTPDLARSDHLPVLTKVPVGEKGQSLTMVSLNILGGEDCSGVHPLGMEIPEGHTLKRYQSMALGLAKSVKLHDVNVILLQEADKSIVPFLEKDLGEDWQVIIDDFGVISCYNKKRLKLLDTQTNKESRVRSMTFGDELSGLSIDVHNIWGLFNHFPQHMEKQYHSLLTQTKSDLSVILGDTNSRLAPPNDSTKRNLTTGIVPPIFSKYSGLPTDIQITDHPDGGFYRGKSGLIHQLTTETLDFDSGEVVIDERSEAEANVSTEYRMVMCLDHYYEETAIIDGKTLFAYEDLLKKQLNDNTVVVRMASDSFNNKAVAIRFPCNAEAFQLLQKNLKNEAGFQFRTIESHSSQDGYQPFSCVFAPVEKVALLHEAVQQAIAEAALNYKVAQRIQVEIDRLSQSHWYFRDAAEKISHLKNLKERIVNLPVESEAKDILSLIKTWESEDDPASSSLKENNLNNKGELMGVHRNVFFKPIRPGKLTETQENLQWLKEQLGDKPDNASVEVISVI